LKLGRKLLIVDPSLLITFGTEFFALVLQRCDSMGVKGSWSAKDVILKELAAGWR
jgi:hypothetical protein